MRTSKDFLKENVRLFRDNLNMTQEELAEKAGCSHGTIQKIEYGQMWPSDSALSELAKALKTTESALLIDHKRKKDERSQLIDLINTLDDEAIVGLLAVSKNLLRGSNKKKIST